MEKELKEILEVIGMKDKETATPEEVKNYIKENYVQKAYVMEDDDLNNKVLGRFAGTLRTKVAQALGVPHDSIKDKDIMDVVVDALKDNKEKIEKLKESSKEGSEKRVRDLQTQNDDLIKSIGDYEGLTKKQQETIEKIQADKDTEISNYLINDLVSKAKSQIKFVDEPNQFTMAGVENTINNEVVWHLNEKKDALIPKTKDGKMIESKKGGGFADATEILSGYYDKADLIKKNNAKDQPFKKVEPTVKTGNEKEIIHPRDNRKRSLLDMNQK